MRIALVTAYKSYTGGMEIFTRRLEKALREKGHTTEWFSFEDALSYPEWTISRLLPFHPSRECWKARALALAFKSRSGQFDIVIANDYFGMYIDHPRVIAVMHGYYPDIGASMPPGFSQLKRAWWDALGRIQKEALARAWKSVTVSPRNGRILREMGCRIDEVIPHGIELDFFSASEKKNYHLDLPGDFLLFAGSAAPWKNPDLAFELARNHPVAWLGNPGRAHPNVMRLPWIADEDMPELYSRARALLHPAFHEGFGYAPIESMACSTPVLFTRAGIGEDIEKEIPEIILKNPLDYEEARRKMEYILSHRGALGKKCRSYVEEHHAWKPWCEKWNRVVEEL